MAVFHINKGLDIALEGPAEPRVESFSAAKTIAIQPHDFPYSAWRVLVQEGDAVRVGSPLLASKQDESLTLVSTVSGTVKAIVRGERRALLRVEVESDGKDEFIAQGVWDSQKIRSADPAELSSHLKALGVWPLIRQRPFSKIANPAVRPKAIFINAMATAPLAAQFPVLLQGRLNALQTGVDILSRFCPTIYFVSKAEDRTFASIKGVAHHEFSGPHPAGLFSTHISRLSPLSKGDTVWVLDAEHAALIGEAVQTGRTPSRTVVAVAGSRALRRQYFSITRHARISEFAQVQGENSRVISGDVLTGYNAGKDGFIGFYDHMITCIPEGGNQYYLTEDRHWSGPGFGSFSAFRLFASSLFKRKQWDLNTSLNGGPRAIILSELYEKFVPLDIEVTFLVKAILAGDVDEMEKLGLLEIDPEDVALCTFACPSKTEVSEIIRQGLTILEKEG